MKQENDYSFLWPRFLAQLNKYFNPNWIQFPAACGLDGLLL